MRVRCTCAALRCTNRAFSGVERGRLGPKKNGQIGSETSCKSATSTEGEGFEPSVDRKAHNGFRDSR